MGARKPNTSPHQVKRPGRTTASGQDPAGGSNISPTHPVTIVDPDKLPPKISKGRKPNTN